MSELEKLFGKPKDCKIGELTLRFHPLTVDDMPLILGLQSKDEKVVLNATKEITTKTLKMAVPDATDEEIARVAISHFNAIQDAILDVNGLKDADQSKNRSS